MEEKAKPNDKWSGWRKNGTQTITLISLTNPVNEISFQQACHGSLTLSRQK